MYPDAVDLLEKFQNFNTRTHKWVKYFVNTPHYMVFSVYGPKDLGQDAVDAKSNEIYLSWDPNMDSMRKVVKTHIEVHHWINSTF